MKIPTNLTKYGVWIPRGLSIIPVLFWLIKILTGKLQTHNTAAIMILIIIALTTAIAWKNSPIGGGIFIIIASSYLVFSMNSNFPIGPVLGSIPLFIVGSLFIVEYLYLEKKENESEGADDF